MKKMYSEIKKSNCLMVTSGVFQSDGGIAKVNRLVLKAFLDKGCLVDVLALGEKAPIKFPTNFGKKSFTYRSFENFKIPFALSTWKFALKNQYQYIFCDHVNIASILAPLKLLGKTYIVWLHGQEVVSPYPDFEGRVGLKFASKRLSSSRYTQQAVNDRFPSLIIHPCDLALDPFTYPSIPEEYDEGNQEFRISAIDGSIQPIQDQLILFVSRISKRGRYKGHDHLLEAFALISDKFPKAQLALIGQGDDRARLIQVARSLPKEIHPKIFIPGYLEESILQKLYRNCYLFAMPSGNEGFGLVYIEAMAFGKPCLGGRIDATPCVILDGVTGVLVDDPKSSREISKALQWMLANPDKCKVMGNEGIKIIREKYLYQNFYERFWDALQS